MFFGSIKRRAEFGSPLSVYGGAGVVLPKTKAFRHHILVLENMMSATNTIDSRGYFCFLDNSNLLHEGQRLAGLRRRWARDIWEAQTRDVLDPSWRMSYRALGDALATLVGRVVQPHAFASFSAKWNRQTASAIEHQLLRAGWKAHITTRSPDRGEKGVDVGLASQMAYIAATEIDRNRAALCLIAGDSDYVPLVRLLTTRGYIVRVAFWGHAANELKKVATEFINLDAWYNDISLHSTVRH
jgi:uncharacterized LabA/DUF88 family protein